MSVKQKNNVAEERDDNLPSGLMFYLDFKYGKDYVSQSLDEPKPIKKIEVQQTTLTDEQV